MEKQRIKAVCCAASAGGMWGTIGLFVSLAGRHGVHSLELTVVRSEERRVGKECTG